jgi:hypothetical protein
MHHDVVAAEAAEVGVEKGVAGEPVDAAIPSVGGYLEAGGGGGALRGATNSVRARRVKCLWFAAL